LRFAITLIALLACGHAEAETPSRYDNGPRQAVEAARAAWASAKPGNYTFTVSLLCFCMTPPIHVTVRGNRVLSVRLDPGLDHKYAGREVPKSEWANYFGMTVPELIALVDTSLKDRSLVSSAQFDGKYGYPRRFHVTGNTGFSDSDGGFSIEDFKVLE
jgi:hypothetical protein